MTGEDIHYTSKDGLNLYAKSYGPKDAPLTALCLHGLTRNHQDFDPMIAGLKTPCRFIAMDVRGRGQSDRDPNPKNYNPKVYVKDVAGLMDHLELEDAAFIGTSMGGLISILMARSFRTRVRGIVLNDIGPELNPTGLKRIMSYTSRTDPVTDWTSAAARIASIQSSVFPNLTDEDWMDLARRSYREAEDGTLTLDYDPAIVQGGSLKVRKPGPMLRFVLWRLFMKTRVAPLLVLRGENSDILSQQTAEMMQERHPHAALTVVPGVGHAPLLNEPESLSAIDPFLQSLI